MSSLNFPASPSLNDEYSFGGKTWLFNGDGWELKPVITTTANVIESGNLYFTNERAIAAFTEGDGVNIDSNGLITATVVGGVTSVNGETGTVILSTANVTEDTNLYFTNARVYSNVTELGYATTSFVSSEIANLVNSAPATLDTLKELADALGSDNNFAVTTATLIGNSYDQANLAYNTAITVFDSSNTKVTTVAGVTSTTISNAELAAGITETGLLTTANVIESGNLYFTNTRAIEAFTAGNQIVIDSNGLITATVIGGVTSVNGETGDVVLTTANITEDTNLYFTNARVYSNVTELGYITSSALDGYATNVQLDSYATTANLDLKANIADLTTANVAELTNLYFTNTRVYANVSPILSDYATLTYVQEIAQGLAVKPAVKAATTTNIVGTYYNGNAGVDSNLTIAASATLNIDGVTTWDRFDGILVKNQSNGFENGRYFVDQVGNVSYDWILTRCIYCDTADEIPGSYIFVFSGDTQANTGWVAYVEDPETFTVGTDNITYFQFSGPGALLAGNGILLTGATIENTGVISVNGSNGSVTLTTTNVSEGTNLYFTNARVSVAVSSQTLDNATFTGNVVAGNVNTVGVVKATSGFADANNRILLIKDEGGNVVWGL